MTQPRIGFVGQGFIGKAYADDFEKRGYEVVRYALEEPYVKNKDKIKECDVVFIAVPTPTTPEGFDASIVEIALELMGEGSVAVIKSTLLPGTTKRLAQQFSDLFVIHSPEFLRERTALLDAMQPQRTIIGIPEDNNDYQAHAKTLLEILPKAPFESVCSSEEAELVKYGGNCFLFTKVIFMNLMYDLSQKLGADFEKVSEAMAADARIGDSHMMPVHASGHVDEKNTGRGAGGHCFIKDFAAFADMYDQLLTDEQGAALLRAFEQKNLELLKTTQKDLDLVEGVYGKNS